MLARTGVIWNLMVCTMTLFWSLLRKTYEVVLFCFSSHPDAAGLWNYLCILTVRERVACSHPKAQLVIAACGCSDWFSLSHSSPLAVTSSCLYGLSPSHSSSSLTCHLRTHRKQGLVQCQFSPRIHSLNRWGPWKSCSNFNSLAQKVKFLYNCFTTPFLSSLLSGLHHSLWSFFSTMMFPLDFHDISLCA